MDNPKSDLLMTVNGYVGTKSGVASHAASSLCPLGHKPLATDIWQRHVQYAYFSESWVKWQDGQAKDYHKWTWYWEVGMKWPTRDRKEAPISTEQGKDDNTADVWCFFAISGLPFLPNCHKRGAWDKNEHRHVIFSLTHGNLWTACLSSGLNQL